MTINFSDHFWGEKNAGFDVLYHNQKNSLISTKELLEFFRERSKLEEASSTQLGKLVSRSSNGANHGSFAPLWQALKTTTEKLSSLHSQMVQKVQELIKDVAKYSEDLHKKHKQVKDEESGTQDAVQLIQVTNANLQKTCLIYQQKHAEWEKLKNEGNASPKELERAEAKCKKALEDYKNFVDKYNSVRSDFERKMTQSCKHFQDLEMSHLRQMKEFISSYSDMMQSNYGLIGQVHGELRHQCDDLTVEKLIEQFVELKKTGSEIPPEASVEEIGVAKPVETLVDVTWMHPETSSMGGNSVSGSSLGGGGDLLSGLSAPPMVNDTPSADQTPPKSASKKEGKKFDTRRKNSQDCEGGRSQTVKASRRTTSFLNLFNAVNATSSSNSDKTVAASSAGTSAHPGFYGQNSSPQSPDSNHGGCKLSVEKSRVNSSDGPSSANHDESMLRGTFRGSKWFLKSRRKKKDKKKDSEVENVQENKLPNDDRSKSNLMDLPLGKPERASPPAPENVEVDNEGFSVPPTAFPANERRRSSFSSSSGSGSDSDSDDDKRVVPMVEIKPLGPGIPLSSASVDELRAVMEGITLGGSGVRASPVNLITQTSRIDNQVPRRLPNSPLTVSSNSETTKLSNDVTALGNRSDTPPELAKRIPPTSPTSLGSSSSGFVDLFKQWGEAPPVIPPKQGASATSDGLSSGGSSIAIPRPPRRSDLSTTLLRGRSTNSSTSLSRADSLGSLASFAASEFKLSGPAPGGPTPPILTSSSRGPSPLTIGMSDTIPIAVAFQEMVHAYFRGSDDSKCQVKLIGDLVMSFPSGIVYALTNNPSPPPLVFCIKNTAKLNSILANKQLLSLVPNQSTPTSPVYEFKMSSLIDHLKRQAEAFPNSHYFNVDILKYQIKSGPGANSAPYQLVTYWKCESTHTDLRIDYKYNGKAAMASPAALLNLSVSVPVDGGVKSMHARPVGKWMEESKRAQWKFTELSSHSEKGGTGSLRARFELTSGPGSPGTVTCQFNCEGTTLSGAEFQLVGPGYRVSLTKKKLVAGKYICDPEVCPPRSSSATPGSNGGERYAAPPGENRYAAPPSETRYAAPPSETRYAAPPGDSRYAAPPSIPQPSTSSPKNASAPTPV